MYIIILKCFILYYVVKQPSTRSNILPRRTLTEASSPRQDAHVMEVDRRAPGDRTTQPRHAMPGAKLQDKRCRTLEIWPSSIYAMTYNDYNSCFFVMVLGCVGWNG